MGGIVRDWNGWRRVLSILGILAVGGSRRVLRRAVVGLRWSLTWIGWLLAIPRTGIGGLGVGIRHLSKVRMQDEREKREGRIRCLLWIPMSGSKPRGYKAMLCCKVENRGESRNHQGGVHTSRG